MKGDNGRLQYLRFCLFEMYVSVVFVIRCVYSTVSLTLVREQHFIAVIYLLLLLLIFFYNVPLSVTLFACCVLQLAAPQISFQCQY